jgi:galactokinase
MYYGMSSGTLAKMYVKDSLKNQGDGFVFEIKNQIDSGSISGVAKLMVDDVEKPLEGVTIDLNGKVREVTGLSWSASLYVSYGATMKIYVPGSLDAGEHTIAVTVKAPEIGQITLPITDMIS